MTEVTPRFPDVTVELDGQDGNAFHVVAAVRRALESAGHQDQVADFVHEAMSGDYDHLLQTCMAWVDVS